MKNKTQHPAYRVWGNMKSRCNNPKIWNYLNYGGRGIQVCQRWQDSFWAFAEDMGPRPEGTSVDRINNDGNYEPENCKWSTTAEQARNTRRARYITIDGVQYHVSELAEKTGLEPGTIFWRYNQGWPADKVFSVTPQWNNAASQKKAAKVYAETRKAAPHCRRGHPWSAENTYTVPSSGKRSCRTCRTVAAQSYLRRKNAQ